MPVEADLHFSSQNLARFWLLGHVFAALRCICTHAHTQTHSYFHTNTHRLIVETRSVCGSVGSFELQTTCNSGKCSKSSPCVLTLQGFLVRSSQVYCQYHFRPPFVPTCPEHLPDGRIEESVFVTLLRSSVANSYIKGPLRNLQNQKCSHHCVESICLRLLVPAGAQIKSVTYVHMEAIIRVLNSSQL